MTTQICNTMPEGIAFLFEVMKSAASWPYEASVPVQEELGTCDLEEQREPYT